MAPPASVTPASPRAALRRLAAAFACALQASAVLAAPAPAPAPALDAAPPGVALARPKVALVLSGGGARGFAHIGVLRVLRELRVPIDIVVGTSMGGVVGGAAGATQDGDRTLYLFLGPVW